MEQLTQFLTQQQIQSIEAELVRWYLLVEQINNFKPVIKEEQQLRKHIFAILFPNVVEGTDNNVELSTQGYKAQGTQPYTRSVDKATLLAMREPFMNMGIPIDSVMDWEPKLVKSEFDKLTKQQQDIVEQVMTIKPGTIKLEIKPI